MNKSVLILGFAVAALSTTALASDSSHAGQKGYVAAYAPNGKVIAVKKCARKGKYTWDYVTCGKVFRAKVNDALCDALGKGSHKWRYRVGNSKNKITNTARCK